MVTTHNACTPMRVFWCCALLIVFPSIMTTVSKRGSRSVLFLVVVACAITQPLCPESSNTNEGFVTFLRGQAISSTASPCLRSFAVENKQSVHVKSFVFLCVILAYECCSSTKKMSTALLSCVQQQHIFERVKMTQCPSGTWPTRCCPNPTTPPQQRNTKGRQMEVTIINKGGNDSSYVIEVGVDDTVVTMRQKVASAVGLAEDSFRMGFGGKDEGEDITELSAGDTILLTKTLKHEALAELEALGVLDGDVSSDEEFGEDFVSVYTLKHERDPKIACLLLQAEVSPAVPDNFLQDTTITTLDLSVAPHLTSIGHYFLSDCISLTQLDLSSLNELTQIGEQFLAVCTSLTQLDLPAQSNVTVIEDCFLYNCGCLRVLDLTPFSRVTKVGGRFLMSCVGLTTLDLSPLSLVEEIESYFLYHCSGLTKLDLSPLSRVVRISDDFLSRCTKLTTLDLPPLSRVVHVGSNFLSECNSLSAVDLSKLVSVTHIGNHFLGDCSNITVLDLSPLSSLVSVGDSFLGGCTSLRTVNLSALSRVTQIGEHFLSNCRSLTELDLSPLRKVTHIGNYFLHNCESITALSLAPLTELSLIREHLSFQLQQLNNTGLTEEGHGN